MLRYNFLYSWYVKESAETLKSKKVGRLKPAKNLRSVVGRVALPIPRDGYAQKRSGRNTAKSGCLKKQIGGGRSENP